MQTLAQPLGEFLLAAVPGGAAFDLVTPVPLHWWREWQRGFNQSQLLAQVVSRRQGIRLARTLKRVRSTASQAGLSNTGRRKNVTAAFRCRRDVRDKRVLLIDDVMTTGSTGAACAIVLKRAGAASVTLLTVARVDRRFESARRADSYSTVGESSE